MTLIQVLYQFQHLVKTKDRKTAEDFVKGICYRYLWNSIFESVDNEGNFLRTDPETGKSILWKPREVDF